MPKSCHLFWLIYVQEFFISGGDGLPRGVVENQVARVRQVIKLQGYEVSSSRIFILFVYNFTENVKCCIITHLPLQTRELIDDIKSASATDRSKLGADTQTLLRILCHRGDSEASQFLKKQYKIPKSAAQGLSILGRFV